MSLKRNTIWNLLGAGVPFLLGIVTIPFLLKRIGIENFGILSLVWAMIGYFSLFDFGLGRALTQQIASKLGLAEHSELPNIIKTGLLFTIFAGLVGGLLLLILAHPLGAKWLNVSAGFESSTTGALMVASLGIPMTTLTVGIKGVIEAYEDFKSTNIIRIFLGLANFAFPVFSVLLFGPDLIMIVWSLVLARGLVLIAHIFVIYKKMPVNWLRAKFEKDKMLALLSFGSWMTISNIVSPLMVVADRFIISSIVGASLVAFYTVPADLLIRILIIPGALAAALFPKLTAMRVKDPQAAKIIYLSSLKMATLFMLPVCIFISIFSFWGLKFWLGEAFAENSWKITSILSIGLLMNGIAQIPFAAVQAAGKAKFTALLHLAEFVFYLPLLFIFLKYFGITGAAVIWVLRVAADLLVLLSYAKKVNQNA